MSPAEEEHRWSEAIAEASEKVRGESPRKRLRDAGLTAGQILFGLFVAVASGALSYNLSPAPEVRLPPSAQAADLRLEAAVVIDLVEAYVDETGQLPPSDMLAPYLESGYRYLPVNERPPRFIVERTAGDVTVRFDGSDPLERWLTQGGGESP